MVEVASGEPCADYVRRHVLVPLGMARSGFSLPSPTPRLASGYAWRSGRWRAVAPGPRSLTPLAGLHFGVLALALAAYVALAFEYHLVRVG